MDVPQTAGIVLSLAASAVGVHGLLNTKPLPLSARLGALAPLDRNQDGRISVAEWKLAGRPASALAALDKNKDGYVEPEEVKPPRQRSGGH
jgi:hypothetical protein